MLKITLEDDTGLIGYKDKNAWTIEDALKMFNKICVVSFHLDENVKIVLELNNYGNTLLAEMPNVFDGNNDYGSSVFVRYKHRVDSAEERIGLKVGENKNLFVNSNFFDGRDLLKIIFTTMHQTHILRKFLLFFV